MATPEGQRRGRANSLPLGRLLGIPLYMHWTFLLLVLFVVAVESSQGLRSVGAGLVWIAAIFGSVLVHETAHCVVARREGVVVQDVLLLPIGGVSEMRSIPRKPGEEFAMAVAGPLTSLGLAVAFGALTLLTGAKLWPPTLMAGSWLARLAWLNALLGAFNLLPALPMDGGRLLRAGLAMREPRSKATRQAAQIARVLALAMIAVGLVWDFWLILIGVFVILAAGAEEAEEERHPSG
jgi:Zn-dependent protease